MGTVGAAVQRTALP